MFAEDFISETIILTKLQNTLRTIITSAIRTNMQLNPSHILHEMVQHSLKTIIST